VPRSRSRPSESRSEAACARSDSVILAPAIPYGVSHHHKRLPGGAVSVGTRPFVAYLVAVLSELVDPNRRRAVVVVNGHGGNWAAITCALDELGGERGELPVAACSWWQLVADALAEAEVPEGGVGHAGGVETSVMLVIEPEAVDLTAAPRGTLDRPQMPAGVHRWLDFALHFPDGVLGAPRTARREFGERLLELASERLIDIAERVRST
jgi:creatinine amidohydrolase